MADVLIPLSFLTALGLGPVLILDALTDSAVPAWYRWLTAIPALVGFGFLSLLTALAVACTL